MNPCQKTLVPTDFSKHSTEAIWRAADLSRRYEASVTLVYVLEPVTYALPEGHVMGTTPQLEEIQSAFEQRLAEATAEAKAAGASNVDGTVLVGPVAAEITDFAEQGGFDLIVMGTHGRTGLRHLVLGSVAEKVVRTAPCAVLTVRVREAAP